MNQYTIIERTVSDWQRLRPDLDIASLRTIQRLVWAGRVAEEILARRAEAAGFRRRGDYEVATTLRRAEPQTLTPVEVAGVLRTSPSGMTGKLDRLESQGILIRASDPNDRRIVKLSLTEIGRDLIDRAFEHGLELYDDLLEDFSEDQRVALDDLLGDLLQRLDFHPE